MNNLKLNNISVNTIFFFLLKIWILTNTIGAFFSLIINDYGIDGTINWTSIFLEKEFWQAIFLITFMGLIYSMPAMLILGLIIKLWTDNKLILVLVSILLVVITFNFTGSMALKNPKTFTPIPSVVYSLVISSLILTIKIRKQPR